MNDLPVVKWCSRRLRAMGTVAVAMLLAGPADADQGELTLDAWLGQAMPALAESPAQIRLDRGVDAAKLTAQTAAEQSAVSIDANFNQALYQKNSNAQEVMLFGDTRATTDLDALVSLRTRGGWEADAGGDFGVRVLDPGGNAYPNRVFARLGYDLGQGGEDGRAKTLEKINVTNAQRDAFDFAQARIDLRVRYMRLVTDLFVTQCQIQRVEDSREAIDKTVATAKLRLDTKTMPYKEYLNFVDLANNFRRRRATLEAQRASQEAGLTAFGPAVEALGGALKDASLRCPTSGAEALEQTEIAALDAKTRKRVAAALPGVTAAALTATTAELAVQLERMDQAPRIVPFVQAQLSRTPPSEQEIGAVLFGLNFRWTVPGLRGRLALRAQHSEAVAADARRRELLISNLARIDTLIAEIQAQGGVFAAIDATLDNARDLLTTLADEERVGLVDSLSYSSVLNNAINANVDLLTAWGTVAKNQLELEIYTTGPYPGNVE